MKKVLFILSIATACLASCKKERTCVCTSSAGSASGSTTYTINDTRKNAKAECEAHNSSFGSASTTCELK